MVFGEPVTDEEAEISKAIRLGSVDDELRLARVLLVRVLRAAGEWRDSWSPGRHARFAAFLETVDEMLARIELLERARALLRSVRSRH
jgi:hypothetical protein